MSEIPLDKADVDFGLSVVSESWDSAAGRSIIEASAARATQYGDVQAYFVPATKLVIDTTLAIMSQPHIETQLPREVAYRYVAASEIASSFGEVMVGRGVMQLLYEQEPALMDVSALGLKHEGVPLPVRLSAPTYIASLAAAPFSDVSQVVGGALKLLKSREVEQPTEVIVNSRGLLAISGIHKVSQKAVELFLGMPYAAQNTLSFSNDDKGPRVTFTSNAQTFLSLFYEDGRGCPAARIDHGEQPLLAEYWEKLVRFLVPPDATAEITK